MQLEQTLHLLRNKGIMHIENSYNHNLNSQKKLELIQAYLTWINRLIPFQRAHPEGSMEAIQADSFIHSLESWWQSWNELLIQQAATEKYLIDSEPWGEVPADQLDKLSEHGLYFHLYECSPSQFLPSWTTDAYIEILEKRKDVIRFAAIHRNAHLDFSPAVKIEPNYLERRRIMDDLDSIQEKQKTLLQIGESFTAYIPLLQQEIRNLEDQLNWEAALASAESVEQSSLLVLRGWIKKSETVVLNYLFSQQGIVVFTRDPIPGEDVPIVIQNNTFATLFQPIADLFALPHYKEIDLTPFFAPFFTLFFGMCFSDAGYGLLLLAIISLLRFRKDLEKQKKLLNLATWLAASAVIFGLATGTVFGWELTTLFNRYASVIEPYILNVDQLFSLSLGIGLFQIVFGMAIRVFNRIKQFGFSYGLSSIGWILSTVGLLWHLKYPSNWSMICWIPGLILIIFWSDPSVKGIGRLGAGIWELYGVTGLFGDVLSYVRLFALGLSSAILGMVVNSIAWSIGSNGSVAGIILALIIFLFGHTLNFGISLLSSFVHPIRLTFVEFYKNAGFTGGGKPFIPFIKNINN